VSDTAVMNASTTLAKSPRLRVLNDRLAGAEYPLPMRKQVRVGHSFENDVVLRGAATAGLSLELHQGGADTLLRVLTGEVVVLGRHLSAGEEMVLPPYLPVRLGEFAFAVGGDDDARWDEAVHLVATTTQPTVESTMAMPRADLRERALTRFAPVVALFARLGSRSSLLIGAGAVVLIAAGSIPVIGHFAQTGSRDPALVGTALRDAGFGGLIVKPAVDGGALIITGTLRDDREVERLQALVGARYPDATVSVETTSAMASAASDILKTNGIDGQARVLRRGVLEVESQYLPSDRQTELTALLKRDIPALVAVEYRLTSTRGPDDLRYFFNSPRFGVASFVDGNPGYIVTADGTRWFKGATLPTGHRIIAIGEGRIMLERAGQVEALQM